MSIYGYATVGVLVLSGLAWLANWWLTRTLDSRFEKREREDREYRMEQIEDAVRQLKGQEVMTNSLLVILRHMITGDHVEDLERAQSDLEKFRKENDEAMRTKAAKYNLR